MTQGKDHEQEELRQARMRDWFAATYDILTDLVRREQSFIDVYSREGWVNAGIHQRRARELAEKDIQVTRKVTHAIVVMSQVFQGQQAFFREPGETSSDVQDWLQELGARLMEKIQRDELYRMDCVIQATEALGAYVATEQDIQGQYEVLGFLDRVMVRMLENMEKEHAD